MNKVLAIDFGASGGRAIIGELDSEKGCVKATEIHRFSNDPVFLGDTMYWDVLRLLFEIKQSIIKSKEYGKIDSIAIDTWGVDFGLLDKDGRLLENPVHYRDKRTAGMNECCSQLISPDTLHKITGIQTMEINTVFQLLSLKKSRPELLERADKMLLMPDLLSFFLCGKKVSEMSIASTTELLDAGKKQWSKECISALGLPEKLFCDIIKSGTVIGMLSEKICTELDIKPMKVISACGHDTQCAVVSVPADENEDTAFLSSGTWSLLGAELDSPVISEKSASLGLSNETGYGGKTTLLKNIIGLWLIQESRRQWIRQGREYSYMALENMAKDAKPFMCFIDPDSPEFTPAGDIPSRIKEYCERTGQYVPKTDGEVMRCIYESLALKYRSAIEQLERCTGKHFSRLCMVGGGTKDRFLSSLTACAINRPVTAGPVEATALGNIAVQLITLGVIDNIDTARQLIKNSEPLYKFVPDEKLKNSWDKAYETFKKVTENA